jgi:hypothetical protein
MTKTIDQINLFIHELDKKHFRNEVFNDMSDFLTDDFLYELEQNDPKKCFNDIYEELSMDYGFFDIDIKYYDQANKYLNDNDPSLWQSLQLAHDRGYEAIRDLNSVILANILLNHEAIETFYSLRNQIIEFFED